MIDSFVGEEVLECMRFWLRISLGLYFKLTQRNKQSGFVRQQFGNDLMNISKHCIGLVPA